MNTDRFKFRARTIDNNDLVYGYLRFIYMHHTNYCSIFCPDTNTNYDCYTKTLEQCTGLKDKNGKLIYEGDIIELCRGKSNIHQNKGKRFQVKFLTHRFCGYGFGYEDCPSVDMSLTESKSKICEVIVNTN